MDVFLGMLSSEWLYYVGGNHELFALHLKKKKINTFFETETMNFILEYLKIHYKTQKDLYHFLAHYFVPCLKFNSNACLTIHLLDCQNSNEREVTDQEYLTFYNTCIFIKLCKRLNVPWVKNIEECRETVLQRALLGFVLKTIIELYKKHNSKTSFTVSISGIYNDVYYQLPKDPSKLLESKFKIPRIFLDNLWNFKSLSSVVIPTIKLDIPFNNFKHTKIELEGKCLTTTYVNHVIIPTGTFIIKTNNIEFKWNKEDMIHLQNTCKASECDELDSFFEIPKYNILHKSLIDEKLTTRILVNMYYLWLCNNGISPWIWEVNNLTESKNCLKYMEEYNHGVNGITSYYNREFVSSNTSHVFVVQVMDKNKILKVPGEKFRFLIIYKKIHITEQVDNYPQILTVRTTILDQKHYFIFDLILHFYKKNDYIYMKNNNFAYQTEIWNIFKYDFYLDHEVSQISYVNIPAQVMDLLATKKVIAFYEASDTNLDTLFPESYLTFEPKQYLKWYLFNWHKMALHPNMLYINLNYLPIKNMFYMQKMRDTYVVQKIRSDMDLENLKEIVSVRLKLFLMISGAISQREYERFKDQKREQLQNESFKFRSSANSTVNEKSISPSLLFCWSTNGANVIDVEEILPYIEDLLIHDAEEIFVLDTLRKKMTNSNWSYWKSEKPYFNVQKCCRELLESGISIIYYPIPVTKWVVDKKMIGLQ